MLSAEQDIFALTAAVVAGLTRYPYYVRIPGFGDDPKRGQTLARMVANTAPLHPRKPFEKMTFARIRVDPEMFAKEGDGTRYSQTERALAPHTDSSFGSDPHELIAFQMVRPDSQGGASVMVVAKDVVAVLDEPTRHYLTQPRFPFGPERRAILSGTPQDPAIRYYRTQIDEDAARTGGMTTQDIGMLDALDKALARDDLQHRFSLEAGEIVLINNRRVLHGRSAMDVTSERLMYRIRVHAGCLI